MDYNTQREKLLMPEYGRHVQKMIDYVKNIPEKGKRNEQIKSVVNIMGILNPQLRDLSDYRHKLWDHVQVISEFDIDIDSPYPIPTKESLTSKPAIIELETNRLKAKHYGRNIQNMIDIISAKEEGEVKNAMVKALASYMRQQYLIWNKDSVTEETIFNDIKKLSDGKLVVSENIHLETISEKDIFNRPKSLNMSNMSPVRNGAAHRNKSGKKKWKNNKGGSNN